MSFAVLLLGYVVLVDARSSFARLTVSAGIDLGALIEHALHELPLLGRVVVASPDPSLAEETSGAARLAAHALRHAGATARLIAPPTSTAAAWLGVRATAWRAVDVGARADRLDRAWLPAALVDNDAIVLVNDLRAGQPARRPLAIGSWAKFAHPRQRTGAALSHERDGLAAEIALAVTPALILFAATWSGRPLLIAATDQIAAELAGRAFLELAGNDESEPGGPWEHPLVQRATELGLGVRLPAEICAELRWIGPETANDRAAFTTFGEQMLARIGVRAHG